MREEILKGYAKEEEYYGGIKRIDSMPLETLKKLVKLGFLRLDERQNDSPTTKEFMEFMEKSGGVLAHGYAVSKDRPDVRITIEGLMVTDKSLLTDIFKANWYEFHARTRPDEINDERSWWD